MLKWRPRQLLPVDYPVDNAAPMWQGSRCGHTGLHRIIVRKNDGYRASLKRFAEIGAPIQKLEPPRAGRVEATWDNQWFAGLDALALYSIVALKAPRTLVEIGSGFSTTFARRSIVDAGLTTQLISIDPQPRAEIDALCDRTIRTRLEDADLALFSTLERGDIVSFDGSHRSFMNSDVTVFFLEVLPVLAPGVVVHIHDIYLPFDYPRGNLYYNEQYLLATLLLFSDYADILLPNYFISQEYALASLLDDFWSGSSARTSRPGVSFWFQVRGSTGPEAQT